MKPISKILNERDKVLFEKALKFYFFARQHDIKRLDSELKERVSYSGAVAYSLIITLVKEDKLKIEYMDFLNQELKLLQSIDPTRIKDLQIKPNEIDEIQLIENVSLQFFDEDAGVDVLLNYKEASRELSLMAK